MKGYWNPVLTNTATQAELKYLQSKSMVMNLQERVRQLETVLAFDDAGSGNKLWSLEELNRLQHAFEDSSHSAARISPPAASANLDAHDHESSSHSATHAESSSRGQIIFASDYFCTWLTTDADAKLFGVKYRAHAVKCGAALMQHKVPVCAVWMPSFKGDVVVSRREVLC